MAQYLIDTDVMIDVSRRNAAAATFVDSLDDIAISIITVHATLVGARNQRDAEGIDSLIKAYPVHRELGAQITSLAYELLKRYAKSGDRGPLHPRVEEPKAFPDDRRVESHRAGLLRSLVLTPVGGLRRSPRIRQSPQGLPWGRPSSCVVCPAAKLPSVLHAKGETAAQVWAVKRLTSRLEVLEP